MSTAGPCSRRMYPLLPGPPAALDAVAAAGFDSAEPRRATTCYDFGPEGIEQTRAALRRSRNSHGRERDRPRRGPRAGDRRAEGADRDVAVLSINCVGPRETWATTSKPGCAYIEVITHYEAARREPGRPASRLDLRRTPVAGAGYRRGARAQRRTAQSSSSPCTRDSSTFPSRSQPYEREIAHALVDAGAQRDHRSPRAHPAGDRGLPWASDLPRARQFRHRDRALSALRAPTEERRASWARERLRLFGFVPDPAMPTYPFHPESRNTAVARLEVGPRDVLAAAVLPFWIDERRAPCPRRSGNEGARSAEYIRRITAEAGFATDIRRDRSTVCRSAWKEPLHDRRKKGPLEGKTVLDLTTALAGPYATLLLASLGARVIKIENPSRGGDSSRNNSPYVTAEGLSVRRADPTDMSVSMMVRGRNKESITLNLKHPPVARSSSTLPATPMSSWRTTARG